MAIFLGTALNEFGKDVVILDANLTTPNVGLHLGAPIVPVSLNHVLSGKEKINENKRFRKPMFQRLSTFKLTYVNEQMWFECYELYGKQIQNINIEFGVDTSGEKTLEKNDDNVITIIGTLPDQRVIVFKQFIGKCTRRDELRIEDPEYLRANKILMDTSLLKTIGLYDQIFRYSRLYHPTRIKVGIGGNENTIIGDIERLFKANGDYTTEIVGRVQHVGQGSKQERIINTMAPHYEAMMVFHNEGLEVLEYQLEYLFRTKKDDAADSEEVAFWNREVPYKMELIQPAEIYTKQYDLQRDLDWRVDV